MATIRATVTLHAKRYANEYEYSIMASKDMSEYGYIAIVDQEVSIDIPDDFNPVPVEIEMLRKAKAKIQAEAQMKANAIDEQIGKLLCLEHKPIDA